MAKKTIKAVPKKAVKKAVKKATAKKAPKEKFTVTTFTERGGLALRKAYEKVGYKLVKSEVTPDRVFLTFEDKE